ncbi:MAG: Fe-S cluster assembly protein SufD [Xanthomonadales bacterium]|nr:Fe-S cluster assembly protein SufD [Xanthomonadales bacterium]
MSNLQQTLVAAAPEALGDLSLPGARDERWRYSSLRALNQRSFSAAPTQPGALSPELEAKIAAFPSRLVFVDGHYDEARSAVPGGLAMTTQIAPANAPAHLPFARAASALPTLVIGVQQTQSEPLHIVSVLTAAAADTIVQQALWIELAAGTTLSVQHRRIVEADSNVVTNAWRDLALADGARLDWLEVGEDGERASVVLGTRARVGAGATFQFAEVAAGAALYRHDLDVTLVGEQAVFGVRGCTMVSRRRHADIHIDARHRAKHTRADIVWRGLADQRGHGIFAGQLIVEAGADGADAALSNKNLLLSPHAEIDTRPVLEIHADEVKAAHGATVGRLDERSLFYLRSRGIPEAEARRILQLAFAREPLLQITDPQLREAALAALARCLPEDAA